jgi:hypothetical protein
MNQQKSTTTSIQVDEAMEVSEDTRTAATELTEISKESLEWVAGGPTGSIGIIGR